MSLSSRDHNANQVGITEINGRSCKCQLLRVKKKKKWCLFFRGSETKQLFTRHWETTMLTKLRNYSIDSDYSYAFIYTGTAYVQFIFTTVRGADTPVFTCCKS